VVTAVAGFVVASSIWWVYFANFDERAIDRAIAGGRHAQTRSFLYGYGHLVVYVAVAASGVAVQIAIEASTHDGTPGLLLPGTLALVVGGFLVIAAGTGDLRWSGQLVAKLAVIASGLVAALVLDEVAAATVVIAVGWVVLAVLKSSHVASRGGPAEAPAG
jgi:low temperature requirement protein LtrA